MKFIGKNDVLFETLRNEISILSSQILGFNIYLKDYVLIIEVNIKLLYLHGKYLKLVFSDLKEYAFYNNSINYVYYIEDYKLLKNGDLYYISFDPETSDISIISENDNDLILCKSIEGWIY